jgi:hypothetical protein
MAYELIEVRNVGDEPVVLRGNTKYEIAPGGRRILPFDVAAAWFGDPRLQNIGKDKMRALAFDQVQYAWGFTNGMKYPVFTEDGKLVRFKEWDDFRPTVECFDVETGERVPFIIDDPEGEMAFGGPALIDPATQDVRALTDMIAQMQQQMASMQQLLNERTNTQAPAPEPALADFGIGTGEHTAVTVPQPTTVHDGVNLPQPPADDTVGDDSPRTVAVVSNPGKGKGR